MAGQGMESAPPESDELPIFGRYGRVALAVTLGLLALGVLLLLLFFVAIQ